MQWETGNIPKPCRIWFYTCFLFSFLREYMYITLSKKFSLGLLGYAGHRKKAWSLGHHERKKCTSCPTIADSMLMIIWQQRYHHFQLRKPNEVASHYKNDIRLIILCWGFCLLMLNWMNLWLIFFLLCFGLCRSPLFWQHIIERKRGWCSAAKPWTCLLLGGDARCFPTEKWPNLPHVYLHFPCKFCRGLQLRPHWNFTHLQTW